VRSLSRFLTVSADFWRGLWPYLRLAGDIPEAWQTVEAAQRFGLTKALLHSGMCRMAGPGV